MYSNSQSPAFSTIFFKEMERMPMLMERKCLENEANAYARCNEAEEDAEALPSLSNEDMQNFLRVN
jgi:hypothetical protein